MTSQEIVKEFMTASWRQKLDYWTSPAGKAHTLAHVEMAARTALRTHTEGLISQLQEMKKEIPQTWEGKEKHWGSIPSPIMARVEFNDAITQAIDLLQNSI